MSVFIYDTYTDPDGTTLASHVPEVGGPLVLHSSFTDTMSIQSNRAGKDGGTLTSVYYYSATPNGLEYTIEADIVDIGNVNRAAGIAGWIDTAADNMIVVRRQNTTTWQFLTILAGTGTGVTMTTGSNSVATTFSAGASTRLKLVRSPGDIFEWFINGASQGTATISDSAFQSPGKVGLRSSNIHTATGFHVDSFVANSRYGARLGSGLRPRIFAPGIAR